MACRGHAEHPPSFEGRGSLIGSPAPLLRCRGGLRVDKGVDGVGEGGGGFSFDGDAQDDGVGGQVVADFEVECVVELALLDLGQPCDVDGSHGQSVDEVEVGWYGLPFLAGDLVEDSGSVALFGEGGGELVLDGGAPGGVEVQIAGGLVVGEFAHEVGLAALQVGQVGFDRGASGVEGRADLRY